MASSTYLNARKQYQRPQGILWADNSGTLTNGIYVPNGYEVGADVGEETDTTLFDQFLVLSDHNRSEISFSSDRIEQRQRTINGRMRSYHVADKLKISFSWTMLPSRSFNLLPKFDSNGDPYDYTQDDLTLNEYTADGGAGGVQVLDWYKNHPGSFWMYLAYDNYSNFGNDNAAFDHLAEYNEIIEVYFADFNYSVVKRGGTNHDLWNISVNLEEV